MDSVAINLLASIAASGTLVSLLIWLSKDAEKLEWHKDSGTRQLIQAVLSTTELKEFDETTFGKVTWLQRRLESKILTAARQGVSRKEFGAEALEQAELIQQRALQITTERTA